MKWSDLTLKERKQIYDAVRAENPNASYFDIKSQFDSIPGYEDGKDNSVAAVYSLPEVTVYPQNKFGDIARTQGYETAKNWQTVRNATTAGINEFVNDPRTQMVLAAVPMPSGIEVLSDAINIGKSASKSKQLFYHGSPVRFDKFDAQFIGSAEGGSKAMKGINLWYKSPKNAPKFANIKSPDAPIHLGRSSKPLGGELNPTVYDVVGTDLNLYKTESNRVKGLLQSNLEALKYDGIQTPSQITVFPGSVNKLKIVKKQSIPDFIKNHPEVDEWTQWTTNEKLRNLVESKIPAYEDGGKKIMPPKELGLTPGTPEYYKRQQQISGKANSIQPEVYVTSAGYIKDAIDFGEDVYQGNYGQAMIDVALNALPWGSSKIAKRAKRYLSRMGNSEVTVLNSKSSKSKVKTEADYDSEFSEVIRRERNIKKYNKELAARDMTNRSKYIKYSELPDGIQGKTIGKNIDPNIGPTIGNYQIQLDPQQYVPGTGSHELSHVVDQLAGDVIKNRYLNFLADSDNIMSVPELEKKGIRIPPKIQFYLSDPQEAKAHMIQLKHAMLNSGKINNWSQKVTQQELEDFLFDPLNTQLTGSMNKLQYKMYRNKSRFLDRFNRVNPLAIGAPIGLAATNNKDKQSN